MTHMSPIVCRMTGPLSFLLVSLPSFLLRLVHILSSSLLVHILSFHFHHLHLQLRPANLKIFNLRLHFELKNSIQQPPLLHHPHPDPALAWPYDPWRPGSPSDWKVSMTPRTLLRSSSFISTSPKPYLTRDSPETRKMFGLYESSLLELRLFSQSRHNHAPT